MIQRHHKNTAIYLGVSILSKGASLFLIPLYTSRLTQTDYGLFGLCQTLYWVVPPLFTLALSSALGRFFFDHREPEARDQTVGEIALPILILCLAAGLAFEGLYHLVPGIHLGTLEGNYLRIVIWTCAATGMAEIPSTYLRCSERAGHFAIFALSMFALTASSTVYFMLDRNLGLYGLLAGMLVGQGGAALYAIVFVLGRLRPRFNRQALKTALHYSIPFIPHMMGTSLMGGVDRWMLDHFHLRNELGLYTLAAQLVIPIPLMTAAWNDASAPRFLASWRDGGDAAARRALPRIVLGFLICGALALGGVLALLPLLKYFVGPRFQPAFGWVPWVGLNLIVGTLFSAFINVLFLRKTTRIIPVLTLSSVGLAALLSGILVPRIGVAGALWGTGLAYAFRTGILSVLALRALRPSADKILDDAGQAAQKPLETS